MLAFTSNIGFSLKSRWQVNAGEEPLLSDISAANMGCVALLSVLLAYFQSWLVPNGTSRVLTLLAQTVPNNVGYFHPTPFSALGQPLEGLLIAAAHLLGELAGWANARSYRKQHLLAINAGAELPAPFPAPPSRAKAE